jgi:hypothetical protein
MEMFNSSKIRKAALAVNWKWDPQVGIDSSTGVQQSR